MLNFRWMFFSFLAFTGLNGAFIFGHDKTSQYQPAPTNRGSGREEIALADDYSRYDNENSWDYRTNWSSNTSDYLSGNLDIQNNHPNYGTNTYYDQNYQNYYQYPGARSYYYQMPYYQDYYNNTPYYQNYYQNDYYKSAPYNRPGTYPSSTTQNYKEVPYSSSYNEHPHHSWDYRTNWRGHRNEYLKGENQISYEHRRKAEYDRQVEEQKREQAQIAEAYRNKKTNEQYQTNNKNNQYR